jgi:hypothetical protein
MLDHEFIPAHETFRDFCDVRQCMEHRWQRVSSHEEPQGLLGIVGDEFPFFPPGLEHDAGPGGLAVRQIFQIPLIAIDPGQFVQGAEIQGPQGAGDDTDRLFTPEEAIHAKGAFSGRDAQLITLKDWSSIGAGVITQAAPVALLPVDEHCAIFGFLVNGFFRTGLCTNRFLAMVARNPLRVEPHVRKGSLLVLVDSQVLERSGGKLVVVLAGHRAGLASRASALVKEEPVLGHVSPPIFST